MSDTNPVELLISRLEGVKPNGNGYVARCPAHDDRVASLSVGTGSDGRALVKCFAGCDTKDIVAAKGLQMSDLFPPREESEEDSFPPRRLSVEDLAYDKRLPVDFLRSLGVEDHPRGSVVIRYRDMVGYPTPRQRLRAALSAKNGSRWLKGDGEVVPYGLDRLADGQKEGFVVLVEGESDCWTLWYHGFPALGFPGASTTRKLLPEYLTDIGTVYFFREPDMGGNAFAKGVIAQLAEIRYGGKIYEVKAPRGIKDPNDWHKSNPAAFPEQFRKALEGSRNVEMAMRYSEAPTDALILDRFEPMRNARFFLRETFLCGEDRTLHHHRGVFHEWTGTHYPEAETAGIRARLYIFLEKAKCLNGKEMEDFCPKRTTVGDAMEALQALAYLPSTVSPPGWIGEGPGLPADEILSCRNGLLHLPSGELRPHTPRFFTYNALPYEYRPDSGQPKEWHLFLDDLWDDDLEARDTLQEMFGYLLTGETRHQKIFLVVGPKRSGKGTIARVLTALLGQANVCAPTLAGLGTNFGLSTLVGKQVAIIADARLGGRVDQHAVAERLLSISGEDGIDIDRKYLPPLPGVRLPTRFLILTNELPRIADSSGALASRFIVLPMTQSFYGKEDHGLTDRLLGELPQILNWAIEGWKRLRERGYFLQPSAGNEAVRELEDLGSPIAAFVRERCETGGGNEVECQRLYDAWKRWCEEYGRDHAGTAHSFGRDLRAVVPELKTSQHRSADSRKRFYLGIRLLPER